jgi:Metallo-peptidase family M12B Reprolysin-like/Disintegrin
MNKHSTLTPSSHETGHTFGAVHDCTSQTCSDGTSTAQQCCPLSSSTCDAGEKYIMNPSTGQGITSFSPCSIGNICSAMGRNSVKTSCLSSNKGVTLSTGPQCGNGIVEAGEDCDCGGTAQCGNNQCCDATTCKFKSGAACDDSNEECCKNCQLASANTVCRPSTGVCDPEEKCTGTSATCPADAWTPDGQACSNGTSSGLTCASGHCTSRDSQCKTLMGSYTQGNDTYACDQYTCTLSCASPEFGSGVCYGLQQNFLDGTPCGGGGKCSNVSSLPQVVLSIPN